MSSFFVELSIVMTLAFILSFTMNKIKQPVLIGYILTGLIAGPLFLNILSSNDGYQTFSHIGVSLLLFIVGLNLNLKLIKDVGVISLITGIGQVLFTSFFGFVIAISLGFDPLPAIILAICLTFSSTIIIVKLLSDKKEIDTLYGRISMGFLLVQDFIAVIILMLISSFLNIDGQSLEFIFIKTILLGLAALISTYFLSRYFIPTLIDKIATSQELLFIFIITWCFGLASLFQMLGFSIEIGALLAGITLASTSYQPEISARVKPLRDFFIVMFFILLGSQMIPNVPTTGIDTIGEKLYFIYDSLNGLLVPAIIFSIFVLVGNPIIVLVLMLILGYSGRTGFLAGLTVAQISEFSLILALMSNQANYISRAEVSMLTLVGIITITASTYMIIYGNLIYKKFENVIKKFEKHNLKDKTQGPQGMKHDILIFGYNRIGNSLDKTIKNLKKETLIVDLDPRVIKHLKEKNINCLYGDASDVEFISEFNLKDVTLLVSTISELETNRLLLESIRETNKKATVILTATHIDHALELYKLGADYVILPHIIGGNYVSSLIEKYGIEMDNFIEEKMNHINELKDRKSTGFGN